MPETLVQSLGREDPLEKELATQSSILAWRIPLMEEPGMLQSIGSQRDRHDWVTSLHLYCIQGFCCGSAGKESACNVGDLGLIPGLGRSPGEGKSYPFQYSGLENSMDCIVLWVSKSRTGPSNFHFHCILYTIDLLRYETFWGAFIKLHHANNKMYMLKLTIICK